VAKEDWNFLYPADLQDYPWDCAAASLAWAISTTGKHMTEQQVIVGLGPKRISPTYGLLDASGAGLVEYLGEIGIGALNDADASFQEVMDAAGHQPMVMGGRQWCHWCGVRMGSAAAGRPDLGLLALMNPSPGYQGVEQVMNRDNFSRLGPFSAVWFTSWGHPTAEQLPAG